MGNSLSPVLCDFVVSDVLKWSCEKLDYQPKFIGKYVDDLFIVLHEDKKLPFLNKMNSLHLDMKFTIEEPINGMLPYLDMKVIQKENRLITDWYCKPTAKNRILNFLSAHNITMKINTAKGMLNRIFGLSEKCFWNKNEELATNILLKNSFPKHLIRNLINTTKQKLSNVILASQNNNPSNDSIRNLC